MKNFWRLFARLPLVVLAAALLELMPSGRPAGAHAAQATIKQPSDPSNPVVVDCVGDSITHGSGASSTANNYPSLLGDLLGPGYKVLNFGESGATLLKNGDSPYWKRESYAASAAAAPNVVIIMLGTNDSKPWNWKFKSQFASDYEALIDYYASIPTHPQIFVCTPPPVPGLGNYGINEPNVLEMIPIVEQAAAARSVPVIDVQAGIPSDAYYFVDRVHPNDNGYILLASAIYEGLTRAPVILPIANRTLTGPEPIKIITLDKGVQIRYRLDGMDKPNNGIQIRYSLDDRVPSRKSPITLTLVTMSGPTTVTAQEFVGKKPFGLKASAIFIPAPPTVPAAQ